MIGCAFEVSPTLASGQAHSGADPTPPPQCPEFRLPSHPLYPLEQHLDVVSQLSPAANFFGLVFKCLASWLGPCCRTSRIQSVVMRDILSMLRGMGAPRGRCRSTEASTGRQYSYDNSKAFRRISAILGQENSDRTLDSAVHSTYNDTLCRRLLWTI
jgi:hypothetical protein